MKAICIQKHGELSDLKVSEVPEPKIREGEVLVKVEASGINPSDVTSAHGRFTDSVLPRILGRDFAGTVIDGPAELVGGSVWGTGGDLGISRNGTHAEYLAVPREAVANRPKTLSVEQAASVGVPYLTAFSALSPVGKVQRGEWVIVAGAGGAVGQAAIQVAQIMGARVIALVRNQSEDWVANSGAVEAVAHSEQSDLAEVVREKTKGKGVDLALNGVGGSIFGQIVAALAAGGRQVVYSAAGGREFNLDLLSFYRNQFRFYGLDTQKLNATECAAILKQIIPLFESGALKPGAISERRKLSEAAEAYEHVAAGRGGKVVFIM